MVGRSQDGGRADGSDGEREVRDGVFTEDVRDAERVVEKTL
jgi:hypothetical protein